MNSNIEIKAIISDMDKTKELAYNLSDSPVKIIDQKDIYYNIDHGRLKLRLFNELDGELIYYRRKNIKGPRKSIYCIYPAKNPQSLDRVLNVSLGRLGIVQKKRHLYLSGQTRIHVDDVKDLGFFLELEVVLKDRLTDIEGVNIANDIMSKLGIEHNKLVKLSYIDLLLNNTEK